MASHSNPYGGGPVPRVPTPEDQAPYGRPPQDRPHGAAEHPAPGASPHTPAPGTGPAGGPWQSAAGPTAQHGPGQRPHGTDGWAVPEPSRPRSITLAFWLIVASGLVMTLTTVLSGVLSQTPEGERMVREQARAGLESTGGGLTAAQQEQYLDAMVPLMGVGTIVMGLMMLAVFLLVAFGVRRGARAARVTGAVFSALSVLMILGSLLLGQISPLDLLWVALGVAGVVMAFRPEATEYMRQKAWQKFHRRQAAMGAVPPTGPSSGPQG